VTCGAENDDERGMLHHHTDNAINISGVLHLFLGIDKCSLCLTHSIFVINVLLEMSKKSKQKRKKKNKNHNKEEDKT